MERLISWLQEAIASSELRITELQQSGHSFALLQERERASTLQSVLDQARTL